MHSVVKKVSDLTPSLSPHELQVLCGGKMLFNRVVDPLNQHAGQVRFLQ